MKILSIGNFGTGWDGSICDEEHIAGALEWLGHDVTRWQREDFNDFAGDRGVIEGYGRYDFILMAQWDGYNDKVLPFVKLVMRKPIVYWAFDYQADGQEWHESLIKEADLYLSHRITDSKYPNWQWLPQDFAPTFLNQKPDTEAAQDIDVLFTGSYLPWATERNETLKAVDDKFNLHIYGITANEWIAQGFKNVHGPVMDEGLPELIARAKINLSIDHTLEAGYWSDRNAQIMACGGFVLFRYIPLSEVAFRRGVKYFYGVEDCLEKIEDYLTYTPVERAVTAMTGYLEADDHLYVHHRVGDLLTIVESIL